MTASNTTPQIPSRDDHGTTVPVVHGSARAGLPLGAMSRDTKLGEGVTKPCARAGDGGRRAAARGHARACSRSSYPVQPWVRAGHRPRPSPARPGPTAAGRPRSRCRRAPRPRPRSGSHRSGGATAASIPASTASGGAGCGAASSTPISALVPSRSPALRRAVSQNSWCLSVNTSVARALTRAVAPANAPRPSVGDVHLQVVVQLQVLAALVQ